jgi:hypothetical protein
MDRKKDKKNPPSTLKAVAHSAIFWIGVERNHTVLLLYVYVFILSTLKTHLFPVV